LDEAVVALRRAIELQPNSLPEIHYTIGVIFLQQGKLDEAANAFQKATQIKPDYGEAIYTLGSVRQQQGKVDEAITYFRAALKFLPEAPEIHNTLGAALRSKGDMDGAKAELQEAARLNKIKTNRQTATFSMNTGIANLKAGKIDEAIAQFENVVKLTPENPEGFYNLAKALNAKGKKADADAAYQRAKQLNPNIKPL
jgi:protein O-GlcNAc transferase